MDDPNPNLSLSPSLSRSTDHLSQINHDIEPNYVPSNIQVYVPKPNGDKIVAPITEMTQRLKQQQEQRKFGQDEVTIIVTGLPQSSETVKRATRKLVQAYMQRYNLQQQQQQAQKYSRDSDEDKKRSSSEEDYSELAKNANTNTGDIIVSGEEGKLDMRPHTNPSASLSLSPFAWSGDRLGLSAEHLQAFRHVGH